MSTPRRALGALVALVVVAVAVNLFVGRLGRAFDLTSEGSATLSEQTRRVLGGLDEDVEITAFFSRDAIGRVEAATLLSRYRKISRHISFRIVDPRLAPGEAERLGITSQGSSAVVDEDGQVETAPLTIEIDLTSAIARLIRDSAVTVCFTTGHGERASQDATPSGLGQAAEILVDNGYRIQTLDLLADPRIHADCEAIVVAAPTSPVSEAAAEAITTYLESQGKAFVLTDPSSDVDVSELTEAWGAAFEPGVVIEGDPGSHLPDDFTSPIVARYSEASPAVRGLGPTFFPGVQGVRTPGIDDPGVTAAGIAFTSELSYLDRGDTGSFDSDVDVPGPVAVGGAVDDSRVSDPGTEEATVLRTRILLWGDVDFASNAFIGEAANARLWVQGVDWLTQPEALVTAVPSFPKLRELELTEARSRYILLLTAGVVPGLFVIAGAFVWILRRGR